MQKLSSQFSGVQLKYIHAYSYDYDLPTTFPEDMRCVAQRSCYPKMEPWFREKSLTSVGGHQFLSIAKYNRFGDGKCLVFKLYVEVKRDVSWQDILALMCFRCCGVTVADRFLCICSGGNPFFLANNFVFCLTLHPILDLYSGLIAEKLDNNIFTKSWGKMHRPLPSNCSIPHHVYNVRVVHLPSSHAFSDTLDHSKWCVAPKGGWTCIADMNREMSQMDRGGGAICIENSRIAKAFTNMIKWYDPCSPVPLYKPVLKERYSLL